MSGLCSAAAWITASMPWSPNERSTSDRSATEPTIRVPEPGATSKPITSWPSARRRGARKRPSQPDDPVRRIFMAGRSGRGLNRRGEPLGGIAVVGPVGAPAEPRVEEQHRQLEEEQLAVDQMVDRPLPPQGIPASVCLQPAVIGRPMAGLVPLDDLEDLGQRLVLKHDRVAQQDVDLAHAPPLGQRDHPAEPLEQPVVADHRLGVEIVDPPAEHDLDEAVDMAAGPVDLERPLALQLEPALEHHIMLALVGPVLLDRGDEIALFRMPAADRVEDAVDARIAPMLVIDVDRAKQVQVSAAKPGFHAP